MGRVYAEITPPLRQWIERQQLFFVGTAPLSGEAHVNVSPKTLSQNEVWSRRKQSWQARSLRNASRKRSERS